MTRRESCDNTRARGDGYPRPRRGLPRGSRGSRRSRTVFLAAAGVIGLALLGLLDASSLGAQQAPPDDAWRTLETEHFRVTFPVGLETLAREAAGRAERAHRRLTESFIDPPDGRTEILLTDHVDVSNGFARVAPYKQVIVFARPPVDGNSLSHFDDWFELVLTHEVAHLFHLDVAGPLGRVLRTVFGDVPSPWPFFPQLGSPGWVVEGLATWYESALSESGRVRGGYHDMILRTAILEGRFESIDEASGRSPVWPEGQRSYVYGSLFFKHLMERHGPDRMERFVEAVGDQWIPYRLNAAARKAFGVSFSDAWREWRDELTAGAAALEAERSARQPLTVPRPVTRGARFALYPRVSPDGRTLVYALSDGRSDVHLRKRPVDGSDSEELVRTNGRSVFSFTPGGEVVFSQLEVEGTFRLFADLYLTDMDGRTRRLTEGARLDHPSVTPDGRTAVAIEGGGGTTELVEVDLGTGEVRPLVPPDPQVHWSFPAVSPDGRWVAVSRWLPGAFTDVVVLDRSTGEVTPVTRDRALDTGPAWSPDGRWLVWSSDRSGISNVLAAPFDPGPAAGGDRLGEVVQVTNVLTGVQWPSVSPDGAWLYVSTYHADGWDVERIPFEPAGFFEPFPLDPRFVPGDGAARANAPDGAARAGAAASASDDADDAAATAGNPAPEGATVGVDAPVRGYRALDSFVPRYWEIGWAPAVTTGGVEVMGASWGAVTSAEDVVGRHVLDLEVLLSTTGARPSGRGAYTWRGLGNPELSVVGGQSWSAAGPFRQVVDGTERTFLVEERERSLSLATRFLRPRFRNALFLRLAAGMTWESRTILEPDLTESGLRFARPDPRLADLRATLGWSSVRAFPFSVSDEEGLSVSVTARRRHELGVPGEDRGVLLLDRSLDETVGELRFYEGFGGPGFSNHVLAFRGSGGVARGPGAHASHYDVGGASGTRETITGLSLFGGRTWLFPVRGYDDGTRSGRNAWSASLEYRFPIALVNAGIGLVPLHVDRVSGSLFVDGGNAWGPVEGGGRPNARREALASVGAELVTDVLTFFSIPVTLRVGLAARLSEGRDASDGTGVRAYFRLGRAF